MDKNTLHALLRKMVETDASDLFLTVGAPPHIKVQGESWPLSVPPLQSGQAQALAYSIMSAQQIADFERQLEANLSYTAPDIGRFRVSVYRQRGETAMVARLIHATIPDFESLGLPPVVQDLALLRRGLLLVVGAAGSGKSTTLASMIDHRARNSQGHILTIEDPIEYLFTHDRCTVDQREVGIDTHSFADALRNAMRQAPDIIMIGEIRDRETMEHAIAYAETGHLCVSTLHAANASQALKRIINFFPENLHPQLRMDLSLNLQAVISQRLLPGHEGKRVLATELLLHSAYVADLILKGAVDEIRHAIEKSGGVGMHTFDQVLLELFNAGRIDQDTALANADSRTDLSLRMRVHSAYDPR
ncbi:MAG: Twitching mobility protein [Alphaproteobacteria bacterium ADurb.Bin100]|jgi:twitching motility protein PilU|nr:MAG: Twitching mobility protein [Alphaproteobacteria bacterium ADurb.Bin100]